MSNQNVLWNSMKNENNVTYTENGDKAYKSTLNPLLDFLFKSGTMRNEEAATIANAFIAAFKENPVYATRLAFYTRDIRGGQGERRVFRICMQTLANIDANTFEKVIAFIPEYGRWDDLIYILNNINNSKLKDCIKAFIAGQLAKDLENFEQKKSISLLAKWLPSENASSDETIKSAKQLRKFFELTPKEYRKMLSSLREYLNIIETKMSSKKWNEINYNIVPSKAMMKYRKAFERNDKERYSSYINQLVDPENKAVKVNASTLYPFDIIQKIYSYFHCYNNELSDEELKLFDAQWKALPDYFKDKFDNAIVVADVSGSMEGNPMNVAIGLALYIAERNKGLFNNKFITFSHRPQLEEICGNDIFEKAKNLSQADWGMNTDLDAVFNLIYTAAINGNAKQADLPSMIYIISDMQFDSCCEESDKTVFEKWKEVFAKSGYELPTVVFWNVSAYGNNNVPITVNDSGVLLCSGYSPAIIKYIMESDVTDTMALIENIVKGERYACILA